MALAAVSDSSLRESSTSGSIRAALQLAIKRIAMTNAIAVAENWLAIGGCCNASMKSLRVELE